MVSEKQGMLKLVGLMWKRIFDYKGKSDRREFWLPFLWQFIWACVLLGIFLIFKLADVSEALGRVLFIIAVILAVYFGVSLIPWISLMVRRLHDVGTSGWLCLISFIVGVGTLVILVICTLGNATFKKERPMGEFFNEEIYDPYMNEAPCIYGPPEMFDGDTEEYDVEDNMNTVLYGPPEMLEDTTEFNAEDNMNDDIYGPPEMFEQ